MLSTRVGTRSAVAAPRPFHGRTPAPGPDTRKRSSVVARGNAASNGPFTPVVLATRALVGKKEFNKLRGQAISLHSQVIKEFCGSIGADGKQAQAVIRLAKKNGEWLGFLS